MNTVVCDWPTSDLADLIGPVLEIWLQSIYEWGDMEYLPGERVFVGRLNEGQWCISEFLPFWLKLDTTMNSFDMDIHEDCQWQQAT